MFTFHGRKADVESAGIPVSRRTGRRWSVSTKAVAVVMTASIACLGLPAIAQAAPQYVPTGTLATDSLSRTVNGGWGSAAVGGAYTVSPASAASVTAAGGQFTLTPGVSAEAVLGDVKTQDAIASADFSYSLVSGSSTNTYQELRLRDTAASAYAVRLKTTGTVGAVAITKLIGTAATTMVKQDLAAPVVAGSWTSVEIQATGTNPVTITARAWPAGTAKPAWQLTYADSAADRATATGPVSIWGYVSSAGSSANVKTRNISARAVALPPTFVHPGILLGTPQLSFVKAKLAAGAQPWSTGLANLKNAKADTGANKGVAYSSLSWTPRPVAYVGCGAYHNPDEGCFDEVNDAVAAYTQALLWYYTGNNANAQLAIKILNAWSAKLIDHKFDSTYSDGHLQAAWMGQVFPRSAEIIRYTYTAPAGQPTLNVSQFSTMLKKAFLPHVINGWTGGGANWVLSMADATMNIGIFNDDRATFDNGVADWRAQVPAAIYMAGDTNALPQLAGMPISPPGTIYERSTTSAATLKNYWHNPTRFISGLEGETLRDINHMAMGFGAMIDGAETARLQGVDLYGAEKNRIVTAMELNTGYIHAAVKGGQNPPPNWVGTAPINTTNGSWKITWEIGYNHFANRLGVAMPNTAKLLTDLVRPSGWRTTLFMDYETLTSYGTP